MTNDASIDGELLDRLHLELADHRGRENAITSSRLSDILAMQDGEASPKTREAIRVLSEERGVPVVASSQGYYIPESERDVEEYIEGLRGRKQGIEDRIRIVQEAWDERGHIITDGGEP